MSISKTPEKSPSPPPNETQNDQVVPQEQTQNDQVVEQTQEEQETEPQGIL